MITSTTNTKGIITLSINCEEKGCKHTFAISGDDKAKINRHQLYKRAIAEGHWTYDNAKVQRCPEHKRSAVRKLAAKVTPSKSKVAQTKVERKAATKPAAKVTTTKSGAKVTVGNRVPAKSQPATFSGGQSTGKLAKSAKK